MLLLRSVIKVECDIGKLINLIYESECNNLDRVVMEEDFQIHKLCPTDGFLPYEDSVYPIYYYRDKKGNEIFVNSHNEVAIKLKNKRTVYFNTALSIDEEEIYLEETINNLKDKILIKK